MKVNSNRSVAAAEFLNIAIGLDSTTGEYSINQPSNWTAAAVRRCALNRTFQLPDVVAGRELIA
jgi:hypothetical protein